MEDRRPGLVGNSTRVIVLSADSLGDQILRAPLLRGLAEEAATVTVVVQERVAQVLSRIHPALRPLKTRLVPWKPGFEAEEDRLVAEIGAQGPDLIVHAPFVVHAAHRRILHRLAGHRRAGLVDPRNGAAGSGLLDIEANCSEEDHAVARGLALLRELVDERVDPDLRPRLRLHDDDLLAGERVLRSLGLEPGRYAVVVPAATANIGAKRWRAEGIARVIAGLADDHGLPALLVGAAAEEEALDEVAGECARRGVGTHKWVGEADQLPTLFGALARARIAVGIDSGPLHAAAALGLPVVASVGGANWPHFIPAATRVAVITRRLPCFNCNWRCWLDQPACFVHEADPFLDAIDWALAGDEPGVQIREQQAAPRLERRARRAVAKRSGRSALRW